MTTITLPTGDGHTLTYDLDKATWALTDERGKTVQSGDMAEHEVTQLRDGLTPREAPPSPTDRIAALEATLVALTKTAAVKDDPELAKVVEKITEIEDRTKTAKLVDEEPTLPVDPPKEKEAKQ